MDFAAHIDELRTNGKLLAAAADRIGASRAIPLCPGSPGSVKDSRSGGPGRARFRWRARGPVGWFRH